MHDTLFAGNSIGYNVPDVRLKQCLNDGQLNQLEPAAIEIACTSGWYNVGAYNGASGMVRSEFVHTFTNKTITVSPGISAPPATVSFSISGASSWEYEKTWVYAVVSPY